jgi:hypothetical protein
MAVADHDALLQGHFLSLQKEKDKKKKRLQPWDNCKRLKFGGHLPHPGNRLTPSVELTTWYLVAPLSLLQPWRQRGSSGEAAL